MINFGRLAGIAPLFAFGLSAAAVVGGTHPAEAADVHFIGGQNDTDNSWNNAANWASAVPGQTDTAAIDAETDPDVGVNGAIIDGTTTAKAKTLDVNASLAVLDGGKLTVTGGIANNGGGYFSNNGTVTANTITNNYTDDEQFGYISNTRKVTADLHNRAVVYNGAEGSEDNHVVWIGDLSNSSTGDVTNTNNAVWQGVVIKNEGFIENTQGATWKGGVTNNGNEIDNDQGSLWQGDVTKNTGQINNIGGSRWQGDVGLNTGSLNNDGGTWTGDVTDNEATLFNTADSTWNGNLTSSGDLWLSGTVNGSVTNEGGAVHVYDPLQGVTGFVNNGGGTLDMDDGLAGSTFSAENWSGDNQTGEAALDVALGLGKSDHVVLSGDYSADTHIDLYTVGPAGRTLGDIPLILVGGQNTGTVALDGLPGDGVISYRLAKTDAGWVIASSVNDAPSHVADMLGVVGDAVASATQVSLKQAETCGQGAWTKGLGASHAESLPGVDANFGFGGIEMGYDFSCLGVGSTGAKVGGGVLLGTLAGDVSAQFSGDDALNANFGEGFAGAYGKLAAGPVHAVVQGQVGVASYRLADPGALVPTATLVSTRYDLSGSASYDLALGAARLAPELGFAAAQTFSTSTDFADVGKMGLLNAPTLDVHAGATLSGNLALGDGATTLAPFASIAFHDALVSPGAAAFSDGIGNSVAVPVSAPGNYVALGVGADLLRVPATSGTSLDAGLRADLKYGENVSDTGLSGHVRLEF